MTRYMTQDEAVNKFSYSPDGHLIWRERCKSLFPTKRAASIWHANFSGKRAGSLNSRGYAEIKHGDQNMKAHRLIWIWHHGEIPDGMQIDHIDGNPSNNKIENLRLVTALENARNAKLSSRNISGVCGVSWDKANNRWRVRIGVGSKGAKLIGAFTDYELAVRAAEKARCDYGYSERHGK